MVDVNKEINSEEDNTSSPNKTTCTRGEVKIYSKHTESFAEADYVGVGYFSTLIAIVRSKVYARFQFILLFGCAIVFLWYGNLTLNRAITNTQSEFKPKKKDYTMNYRSNDQVEPYEVPYIDLNFFIRWENEDENFTNMADLFDKLLQSQDYFNKSTMYRYEDLSWEYANVSPDAFKESVVRL